MKMETKVFVYYGMLRRELMKMGYSIDDALKIFRIVERDGSYSDKSIKVERVHYDYMLTIF